jgi:hypothetical protein
MTTLAGFTPIVQMPFLPKKPLALGKICCGHPPGRANHPVKRQIFDRKPPAVPKQRAASAKRSRYWASGN